MLTRSLRSALSEEDGVGLVELMVVMTLMTIIGAVVMTSLIGGMKANARTQTRHDALAQLQKSVDRMTGPLRGAAPVNAAESITAAAAATGDVAVVEVWDSNFVNKFRYTYRYCPTPAPGRIHLRRTAATVAYLPINCATTTAPVLIDQVTNAQATPPVRVFTYRGSDGSVLSAGAADTSVFQIDVKVRRSLVGQTRPILVETQVRLRNAR